MAGQPIPNHRHAVQFYGNDASLITTVAGFLSEGLVTGQPAVVIATEAHRRATVQQLAARLVDVAQARHIGDLVLLDAEETLATFMTANGPDPVSFRRNVGTIMRQALGGRTRTPVRAYGEMVDLLWKQGQSEFAIRLEVLWNDLATAYNFALLCGYSIGNFYKQTALFDEVCRLHTQIIKTDASAPSIERRRGLRVT